MPTLTTTSELIRDGMIATIAALTPSRKVGNLYRVAQDETEFRLWCSKHVPDCFRRFTVSDVTEYQLPLVSNLAVEFLEAELVITVAYPKKANAIWGQQNMRDAESLVDLDMHQIDSALAHRGAANYVSGQCATESKAGKRLDKGGEDIPVMFLSMRFIANFYRSF